MNANLTDILETLDQFQDELKKTAVQAGGSLDSNNKEHQAAYSIFGKMVFATMSVLKPHKDMEFFAELAKHQEANQLMY